jgi:hypothetical protein
MQVYAVLCERCFLLSRHFFHARESLVSNPSKTKLDHVEREAMVTCHIVETETERHRGLVSLAPSTPVQVRYSVRQKCSLHFRVTETERRCVCVHVFEAFVRKHLSKLMTISFQ